MVRYSDIHINEAALGQVSYQQFSVAQLVDEKGRARDLLGTQHPQLQAASEGPRHRLLVHVDDATDGATYRRVWARLRILPADEPF